MNLNNKHKSLITLMLVSTLFTFRLLPAQDTTHTLINFKSLKPKYLGLFLAPEFQMGQLNNAFTSFGGGSFMVLINKRFGIGVSAQRNLNESFSPSGVSPLNLRGFFGGLKMEYTTNPNSAIHLSFPLVLGMGRAEADSLGRYNFRRYGRGNDFNRRNSNEFFIVQPGIQIEANIIPYIKVFAGTQYRVAFKVEDITIPTNTFNGLSFNLGMKLGLFDYRVGKKKAEGGS